MNYSSRLWVAAVVSLVATAVQAEDVLLPAPVLQWSFYIFLMFALVVAVGIFFIRDKKGITDELLGNLIEDSAAVVHSVGPFTEVSECVRLMNEYKIGAMLVMDNDQLVGIFTERDCLTRVVGEGLDPKSTRVGEVMTKNPYCVSPSISLEEAMKIITQERFRHLPVVENGKVLGVISSGDLTRRLVVDRPMDVRELVEYLGSE